MTPSPSQCCQQCLTVPQAELQCDTMQPTTSEPTQNGLKVTRCLNCLGSKETHLPSTRTRTTIKNDNTDQKSLVLRLGQDRQAEESDKEHLLVQEPSSRLRARFPCEGCTRCAVHSSSWRQCHRQVQIVCFHLQSKQLRNEGRQTTRHPWPQAQVDRRRCQPEYIEWQSLGTDVQLVYAWPQRVQCESWDQTGMRRRRRRLTWNKATGCKIQGSG